MNQPGTSDLDESHIFFEYLFLDEERVRDDWFQTQIGKIKFISSWTEAHRMRVDLNDWTKIVWDYRKVGFPTNSHIMAKLIFDIYDIQKLIV